jgi:hypothetical protein
MLTETVYKLCFLCKEELRSVADTVRQNLLHVCEMCLDVGCTVILLTGFSNMDGPLLSTCTYCVFFLPEYLACCPVFR